jgi:hypothetical protein
MQMRCIFIEICKIKTKTSISSQILKCLSYPPATTKPSQASRTGYINTGRWSERQRTALDKGVVQITEPGASLTGSLLQSPWRVADLPQHSSGFREKQGGSEASSLPTPYLRSISSFCPLTQILVLLRPSIPTIEGGRSKGLEV